jgi:hypothetical protein
VLAKPIREARNDRPCDQSDCGSSRQHGADLRGTKAALMEKRWQERGCDPEGCEHRAVKKQKAIKRPKPCSDLGERVSRWKTHARPTLLVGRHNGAGNFVRSADFANVMRLACGVSTAPLREHVMAAIRRHSADPAYG